MRISDWSSDVCSSDLREPVVLAAQHRLVELERAVLEDAVPEAVPEAIERRVRTFQPAGGGELAEHPPPLPVGLLIAGDVAADLFDRPAGLRLGIADRAPPRAVGKPPGALAEGLDRDEQNSRNGFAALAATQPAAKEPPAPLVP